MSSADSSRPYVVEAFGRLRRFLEKNFTVIAATFLAVYLLFGVDQVFHIWWAQLPALKGSPYQWLLLAYVILLGVFNLTAFLHASLWFSPTKPKVLAALQWVTDWPLRFADQFGSRLSKLVGLVLAATGAAILLWGASGQSSRVYSLSGLACQNSGVVLAWAGAWFFFRGVLPPHGTGLVMAGRILGWLAVSGAIGEIVWILAAPTGASWGSYRLYTICAVFQLLTFLMLASRWVDIVHASTPYPVRTAAVAVTLTGLYFWTGHDSVRPEDYAYDAPAASASSSKSIGSEANPAAALSEADRALANAWFAQFQRRLDSIPKGKGPAVLVAAAGGGSRAAAYAALTYDTLARTTLPAAKDRTLADNIVLISSVSGGSLASAYFVQTRAAGRSGGSTGRPAERADLLYSIKSELQAYLKNHRLEDDLETAGLAMAQQDNQPASRWPKTSSADFNDKMQEYRKERDDLVRHFQTPTAKIGASKQKIAEDARRLTDLELVLSQHQGMVGDTTHVTDDTKPSAADSPGDPWPLRSAAFDDMCTDFMAPVLRGTISVTFDRGDALARFWTRHYGWAGANNMSGYARKGGPSFAPTDPVVFSTQPTSPTAHALWRVSQPCPLSFGRQPTTQTAEHRVPPSAVAAPEASAKPTRV